MNKITKLFFFSKKIGVLLFIKYPIFFISLLTCRNKNRIVVGSQNGFSCNSKYFFLKVCELLLLKNSLDIVWVSRDKNTVKRMNELGYTNSYYMYSFLGMYYLLSSGIYVVSHTLDQSLSFWTLGRAKYVNLWHGVGIKNLRFKSKSKHIAKVYEGWRQYLYRFFFPDFFKKPDLFLSTSDMMTKHFKECFRLSDENIVTGMYPRCEHFLFSREQQRAFVCRYESDSFISFINSIEEYSRSYIYMPTWRDNNPTFIKEAGFDWGELNSLLMEKNEIFIMKLHPLTPVSNYPSSAYKNIIVLDRDFDIYAVLPFIDVLITDYSSIYYDFILMSEKSVLLFPFDKESYVSDERDLAFDYDIYTAGKKVYSFSELINSIQMSDYSSNSSSEVLAIKNAFWSNYKDSSIDIVQRIKKLVA